MTETVRSKPVTRKQILLAVAIALVIIVAATVGTLSSSQGEQAVTPASESEYLEFARYLSDNVTDDDTQLLKAGYSQCEALQSGATEQSLRLSNAAAGNDLEVFDAIFLSATVNLCPDR